MYTVTLILPTDMTVLEHKFNEVMAEIVVNRLSNEELGILIEKLDKQEKMLSEVLQKKTVKETMTIDEASEFSGIGKSTIIELTNKENTDFPYFKVKSKKLINRTLFIEWLNKITTEHRTI